MKNPKRLNTLKALDEQIAYVKANHPFKTPHKVEDIKPLLHQHLRELYAVEKIKYDTLNLEVEVSQFLGSCQYKPIEDAYFMYKSLYEEIKLHAHPDHKLVYDYLNTLFGILNIPLEGLKIMTKEDLLKDLQGYIDNYIRESPEEYDEPLPVFENIEDYYKWTREDSWDLLSASSDCFYYDDDHLINYEELWKNLDGDSELIGLNILCHEVLYNTPLSAFCGFST